VSQGLKLGVELLARQPAILRLGTFFETWIATPRGTVRRSLGRDEYHLGLRIATESRLAATGRTHICQVDLEAAELGRNQARTATLAEAEHELGAPLIWGIRTNLFLDLPTLTQGTKGLLLREGAPPVPFTLDHHQLITSEVAPGRYIVDLSRLLFTSEG
jgi:hypothetical protein